MPKNEVQAIKGFVYINEHGQKIRIDEGQVLEMPKGANWLDVGFAVPYRASQVETATAKPAEKAVTRKKKTTRKKSTDKVMSTKDIKK